MSDAAAQSDSAGYEEASYIMASRYRTIVVDELGKCPATPSGIATATDIRITHASRALHELRERGLVQLLVPDHVEKGRIYGITESGRQAAATPSEVSR